MKKLILSSVLTASLAGISNAALITWSTPADIVNENVIFNPATVVQAYDVGGPALTITVGGTDIDFLSQTGATGITANFPAGNNNTNAEYWLGSAPSIRCSCSRMTSVPAAIAAHFLSMMEPTLAEPELEDQMVSVNSSSARSLQMRLHKTFRPSAAADRS